MQPENWRLADDNVNVADALLDRCLQQLVDEDGCHELVTVVGRKGVGWEEGGDHFSRVLYCSPRDNVSVLGGSALGTKREPAVVGHQRIGDHDQQSGDHHRWTDDLHRRWSAVERVCSLISFLCQGESGRS